MAGKLGIPLAGSPPAAGSSFALPRRRAALPSQVGAAQVGAGAGGRCLRSIQPALRSLLRLLPMVQKCSGQTQGRGAQPLHSWDGAGLWRQGGTIRPERCAKPCTLKRRPERRSVLPDFGGRWLVGGSRGWAWAACAGHVLAAGGASCCVTNRSTSAAQQAQHACHSPRKLHSLWGGGTAAPQPEQQHRQHMKSAHGKGNACYAAAD